LSIAVQVSPSAVAAANRPNIILFLVDDMGLMDTSVPMLTDENGKPKRHPLNDWYRTPGMERLARQGVRFSNFYAHNVCSPTRISIMTGQNAARHRCTDYIFPWQNNRLIDNRQYPLAVCQQVPPEWNWAGLKKSGIALPRLLKEVGYKTIHVGKGHFAPDNHEGTDPRNLGFDVNVAGSCIGAPGSYYGKDGFGRGRKAVHARPVPGLDKYHGTDTFLTEALTLEAKAEIDKVLTTNPSTGSGQAKPFFLYMSHYAVHSPFQSDPRFAAKYKDGKVNGASKKYATMIEGMDKSLGDLMDHLTAKGVAENTLIIFLGDNGGDAPLAGTDDISSSAPLRGRKGSKWEGGVRVPFIAAWAKRDASNRWQKKLPIAAGGIRQEVGACYDLLPTILGLVDAPVPANHPVDGQNLTRLLTGQSDTKHRNVFLNHYPHPRRGQSHFFTTWRKGNWKVRYEYFAEGVNRYGLYDLASDPSESRNLAAENPEQLRSMMQGMVRELKSMDAVYPVKDGRQLKPVMPSESNTTTPARGAALFTEDFNGIRNGGSGKQWQTGLPLKHSANLPGWTRTGRNSIHAVQHAGGDWAVQALGSDRGDNILTLNAGFSANVKGKTYVVSFEAGPSVWAGRGQATEAGHQFSIELLRADDTVLAAQKVSPGAWAGKQVLSNRTFTYRGDGSGGLRFRLAPVDSKNTCFHGAIDNLQVFRSEAEAAAAVRKRAATREERKRRRAQLVERRTPLEEDWLFQARNNPTMKRVQQETVWARELADRIGKASEKLDLSAELRQLGELEEKLGGEPGATSAMELYFAVRRLKRTIAFKNPAVDFSGVLLVDNPYPEHRHESGHRHGYRAGNGKGRLLVLQGLTPDSPVRSLVPEEKAGFLWRPDLSFDATKVVFCLMPEGEKSFHLYEINVDGSGFRQLTFGDYDDLDPIHLPNGKLMFTTTRGHTYVRCGPTHHSPVLARCDADGSNIYIISRNNEPDFLPALLPDGRVIYTRWEYTDKEQQRVQSLWTMNPDGTGVAAFWGNQSVWPDMLVEPRPIPGSDRILFTGVGHHRWFQGSIGIIDPTRGMNYPNGLSKVTPEIAWPEVGNGPQEKAETGNYRPGRYSAYKTPYPISKEDFLVSILRPGTRKFSLYLMDVSGNRELIYTGRHNVWHAVPLKPRRSPPVIPDKVKWPEIGPNQGPLEDGVLYSASVFEGAPLLPRDKAKYLRVLQIDHRTYTPWKKTFGPSGPSISISQADGVKRILGTTPVESDGSVCFKVPPAKALHFQLLDKDFRCLQTMRSFTGVMPGEVRGCTGCHEGRSHVVYTDGGLAMRRGPLDLTSPPWGAEVSIGYERFVQPVLDRYCGKCHQGDGKARGKLDLTWRRAATVASRSGRSVEDFSEPYITLMGGGATWFREVDEKLTNRHGLPIPISGCLLVEGFGMRNPAALATLKPMTHLSSASLLIERAMDEKHIKAKMAPDSLRRLIGWVDANGPYLGEKEIRRMPDPTPQTMWPKPVPVVKPRLKTAPRINRFNIRQDGDSSKIYLDAE